jgi:hypothetical protein
MSASAPLTSSSSTAPTAASATSTPFIAYDLRDGSNGYASLAIDGVDLLPSASIRDLRRAVFAANANKLRGRDYTDLDVYPPGSSDVELSNRGAARDPEDPISSLLPAAEERDRNKRRIIIVARPLPAAAVVQGERASHHTMAVCCCREITTLSDSLLSASPFVPLPQPRRRWRLRMAWINNGWISSCGR